MGVYILTPTGVTKMDANDLARLDYNIKVETQKGNHVVDSHGMYFEQPILTSGLWDNPTGPDSEGR